MEPWIKKAVERPIEDCVEVVRWIPQNSDNADSIYLARVLIAIIDGTLTTPLLVNTTGLRNEQGQFIPDPPA